MYLPVSIKLLTKPILRAVTFKNFTSKVPDQPVININNKNLPIPTKIDKETIDQLEKVSLVNFESSKGIEIVEEAIRFADQLFLVNTEGVEPLVTVLEDKILKLREDIVNEGGCYQDILKNAKEIEDDYFVAPPETFGYLNFKSKTSKSPKYFFGPPGEILAENIKREWLYSVSLHRECNVYPMRHGEEDNIGITKECFDSFILAKEFNNSELPFGLVEIKTNCNHSEKSETMYPRKSTILRYFGFYNEEEVEQSYYRWLLQRKRWWRKFSNDPGKFSFTEPDKTNQTRILAKFPWGDQHIETVFYHGANMFLGIPETIQERLMINNGRKKYLPHLIESRCSLDYAVWTFLCDAFKEGSKTEKPIIRLHKNLAPYKFTAAAPIMPSDKLNELLDLSNLILLELRKEGLHCLLPLVSTFGTVTVEKQLERSNALAIPYTVILTEDTLETGIFRLYSRETTLQEQVHISKMTEYGQLLINA